MRVGAGREALDRQFDKGQLARCKGIQQKAHSDQVSLFSVRKFCYA
jgi:hypothetical protein